MKEVFDQALTQLKKQLEPWEFQRWINPVKLQSSSEDSLTIQVPNIFFKTWINENYFSDFKRILFDLSGREIEINYSQRQDARDIPNRRVEIIHEPEPRESLKLESGLNKKYTFSNFVVGDSNQLAHAASLAIAKGTASYNLLFIYGGTGLGKTHLLCAIGNMLLSQDKNHRVVFLSSEKFTNELIEAMRMERMNQFRQKYRNIDTLLIDDIHFIGGNEKSQEEFFYTFNALYETDKQLAFTSDKVPKQIPDLEKRLRSRFEGGLFADISPPDQEARVAILHKKAEEAKMNLSREAVLYIASHNESNIRILEGQLARLKAYSTMTKAPITLELAQKILGQFIESEKKQITLDHILRLTAGFFNVKISELKSDKKHQAITIPRQAAMHLARRLTSLSTVEIGRRVGGRDHSTVIHADKKIKNRIKKDKDFGQLLYELEQAIRSSGTKI